MLILWASGKDDPEMAIIAAGVQRRRWKNFFVEAAEQEKEWATYLSKTDRLIGLNAQILGQYVEYITNVAHSKPLALRRTFSTKHNPIPWINALVGKR